MTSSGEKMETNRAARGKKKESAAKEEGSIHSEEAGVIDSVPSQGMN